MPVYNKMLVNRWGLPEDASVVTIYINLTEDGRAQGQLLNSYVERPIVFEGLGELLLFMDLIYDRLGYPYTPSPHAKFILSGETAKAEKRPDFQRYREHGGDQPASFQYSFEVKVLSRDAETWQGNVTWKEKNLRRSFSSALQFLHMMADALGIPRLR